MKKTSIVLFFLLFLIFSKTQGQPAVISNDSINIEVFDKSPDTSKVKIYMEMSNIVREKDLIKSQEYLQKALLICQKIHFIQGEVRTYMLMGILEIDHFNYPKALEHFQKSYKIATENHLVSIDLVSTMSQISFIYNYYKRQELVLKYATNAKEMLKRFPPNRDNSYVFNSLASVFLNLGQADTAIAILNQVTKEYAAQDNSVQYCLALNYLSSCYTAKKQHTKALQCLFKAMESLNDSLILWSGMYMYTLNNMGNIYSKMGKYDSAFFYLSKSLHAPSGINKTKWMAINSRDIAMNFFKSGNPVKAEVYANNYIDISRKNNFIEDIRRGYKLLYTIYLKEKNYNKALEFLTKYSNLNDSLNSKEQAAIVMNVYLKNIINEQEIQNRNLKSDNRKKELVIKDKQVFQIILIIISTFIFIFTIVVIYLFIQYKITNNLLKQQSEEILQKNSQLGSQNQLLTELNEEIKGIIGIVSHDLKAPINRIESLLGFVSRGDNLTKDQEGYLSIATKEVSNSKELIKKILDTEEQSESHKVVKETFNINSFLNEIALKHALQAENKNITLVSKIPQSVFEVTTNKYHLSRILDNLLSNAIKFSEPDKNIHLSIVPAKTHILLTIKDEGPGFSEEDLKNIYKKYQTLSAKSTAGESSTGLGLYIVKQLTFEIGASIDVESKHGAGSTFNLKIPLSA